MGAVFGLRAILVVAQEEFLFSIQSQSCVVYRKEATANYRQRYGDTRRIPMKIVLDGRLFIPIIEIHGTIVV